MMAEKESEDHAEEDKGKKSVFECEDRLVIADDAFHYLEGVAALAEGVSVFTSMPDISEIPTLFHGYLVPEYKAWFTNAAVQVLRRLHTGSYAVFLQSDVRMVNSKGHLYEWIDKAHLIASAAEKTHCTMVWHKLVLTSKTTERKCAGKPSYSHLLCFVKNPPTPPSSPSPARRETATEPSQHEEGEEEKEEEEKLEITTSKRRLKEKLRAKRKAGEKGSDHLSPTVQIANLVDSKSAHMVSHNPSEFFVPDVFYRGEMLWVKGIGLDCCYVGMMFLRNIAKCHTVFDPFVGQGTVLAMANALGLKAIGVEISRKRCKKAFALRLKESDMELISPILRAALRDAKEEKEQQIEDESQTFGLNEAMGIDDQEDAS